MLTASRANQDGLDPRPSQSPSATVLLVDDEPALLRATARALRAAGLHVEAVSDGESAARLLGSLDVDVVVTDVHIPGTDGIALLRLVRIHDAHLPVVLMSGSPDLATALPAVEHGALRYLCKPIDLQELVRVVRRAAGDYRMAKLRRQASELLADEARNAQDVRAGQGPLDDALRAMWVAYQPIVSWSDRRVFAFEALLRTAPGPLASPPVFLGEAERLGRLEEVGRAVRTRVAAESSSSPVWNLFVNLHVRELLDDKLLAADSPLAAIAERVVLEITERAALHEVPDFAKRIRSLREMGFRVAIDDLGAGFSGLSSFAEIQPDVVKIDMSLVRGVHLSATKRKLIKSLVTLCADIDVAIVAEGVENALERDALIDAGCDLLQGYLFARPAPPYPEATL